MRRSEDDGSGPAEKHYRSLAEQIGKDPEAYISEHLGKLDLDPSYAYLWKVFRDLASRRTFDGPVPEGIPFSEILAYSALNWRPLTPWEVSILASLDDKARELIYAQSKKRSKGR